MTATKRCAECGDPLLTPQLTLDFGEQCIGCLLDEFCVKLVELAEAHTRVTTLERLHALFKAAS